MFQVAVTATLLSGSRTEEVPICITNINFNQHNSKKFGWAIDNHRAITTSSSKDFNSLVFQIFESFYVFF